MFFDSPEFNIKLFSETMTYGEISPKDVIFVSVGLSNVFVTIMSLVVL